MVEKGKNMLRRLLIITSLACAAQAAHAGPAGKVIFVAGAAHVADTPVVEGTVVQEGDLLSTGGDGFIYVKTIDNGLFILRPNTKARIDAYHVDTQNPANSRFKLELLSGVARSKSGDAVKYARQNFRFNTPVAAIGVRGTDFTVYTDQDTSRVAVLNGGVVVSGFVGGCRPDGMGPCEGAASRELSAAQRGQLLQVRRGQSAPQLLEGAATAPDQVSPPRADEPLANAGGATPTLDPKKSESIEQLIKTPPPTTGPAPVVVTPPPVDVVVEEPKPELIPLPERTIQWGRWMALADRPATAPLTGPAGSETIIGGNYVIHGSMGKEYVAPERGSVGFVLKGGEALIANDDPTKAVVAAEMQNGKLSVDFGKAMFTTTFDLVSGGEVFKMMADGQVAPSGRFGNMPFVRPQTNNMTVDGMLSNADGGSAAYIFQRRLDDTRTTNGITYWTR